MTSGTRFSICLSIEAAGTIKSSKPSADLLHWIPISTNLAAGSVLTLTDASATNFPHRFYRVRPVP